MRDFFFLLVCRRLERISAERDGWSQRSTNAFGSGGVSFITALIPQCSDDPIPDCQSGLRTGFILRPWSSCRMRSAPNPRTTKIGMQPDSAASLTVRRKRLSPSNCSSCFGWPRRVDAPAASTIAAHAPESDIVETGVNLAARLLFEGHAFPSVQHRGYFCHDGERDDLRGMRADVETHGRIQVCETLFGRSAELRSDFSDQTLGALARSSYTEIFRFQRKQFAQKRSVLLVAV